MVLQTRKDADSEVRSAVGDPARSAGTLESIRPEADVPPAAAISTEAPQHDSSSISPPARLHGSMEGYVNGSTTPDKFVLCYDVE
jgi:hypothetical protein